MMLTWWSSKSCTLCAGVMCLVEGGRGKMCAGQGFAWSKYFGLLRFAWYYPSHLPLYFV